MHVFRCTVRRAPAPPTMSPGPTTSPGWLGSVTGVARPVNIRRTTHVWEIRITNEQGSLGGLHDAHSPRSRSPRRTRSRTGQPCTDRRGRRRRLPWLAHSCTSEPYPWAPDIPDPPRADRKSSPLVSGGVIWCDPFPGRESGDCRSALGQHGVCEGPARVAARSHRRGAGEARGNHSDPPPDGGGIRVRVEVGWLPDGDRPRCRTSTVVVEEREEPDRPVPRRGRRSHGPDPHRVRD